MPNEIATYNSTGNVVVYSSADNAVHLDVQLADETVWLTQQQIATLFQKAKSTISYHISNIFKEGELDEKVVVRKIRITTPHGAISGKTQLDESVLTMMSRKQEGVQVDIYTKDISSALQLAEKNFNAQYEGLALHTTSICHDRFLIIDEETIYLIGASLKDAGKRLFAFTQMDSSQIKTIKERL